MVREGRLVNHRYKNDEFVTELKYGILNEKYIALATN
jgi:hypothetical protein